MSDPVWQGFMKQQLAGGLALASQSDRFELQVHGLDRFTISFHCNGLVCDAHGEVSVAEEFHVGIRFPADYCRRAEPADVLTWLLPFNIWHPNILYPFLCVGHIQPATELTDLIYQCYEIITYQTFSAHDALNPEAAQWARAHQHLFPVDNRPLKR